MSAPRPIAKAAVRAALLLLLLPAVWLQAQLTPDAPVENFTLPLFDERGRRSWRLQADQAVYLDKGRARLIQFELRKYEPEAPGRDAYRMRAPEAVVRIEQALAQSAGRVEIAGDAFTVTGADWIWQGKSNRFLINKDVRVVFSDAFLDILE